VAHHLWVNGESTLCDLARSLSAFRPALIDRLVVAGLAELDGSNARLRPLHQVFALRAVIAIEAKVDKWQQVLGQARLNRWFASESYALVPSANKKKRLIDAAFTAGVGVWSLSNGDCEQVMPPHYATRFPASYGTWLFNEWIRDLDKWALMESPSIPCGWQPRSPT
jgi:hypothetical protein